MRNPLICIVAALALIGSSAHAMEFQVLRRFVVASGEIKAGDYEKLLAYFRSQPPKVFVDSSFTVDSPGGNVNEAMKLALFISDSSRIVTVRPGKQCMSSCFFLFVAGGFRFSEPGGTVGVHRPYLPQKDFVTLSHRDAAVTYDAIDGRTRRFLAAARVPDALVTKMFATPSDKIHVLTPDELDEQVGHMQPWWEEMAKVECPDPDTELDCMTMRGSEDRIDLIQKYLGAEYSAKYKQEIARLRTQVADEVMTYRMLARASRIK